jgi:hypothetical protein
VVVVPSARTAFVGDLLFLGTSPIMYALPIVSTPLLVAALLTIDTMLVSTLVIRWNPLVSNLPLVCTQHV